MTSSRPICPSPSGPAHPVPEWQEHLGLVLDSLDALVYIADIDTHELLFLNRYGRELFGDVVGQPCWHGLQQGQTGPCAFCTNHRIVGPDGEPTGLYQWEFQNTSSGRWYDCRDKAIRWSDGRLVRLEIATDITECKLARQREEEHLRRLQILTANVPGMVCQLQQWPDGRCAVPYASQGIRDLYGIEPEAVAEDATALLDAIHPEDRERVLSGIQRSRAALTGWRDKWRILQPDGRAVWLEGEAQPQALPDASVLWHGHVRDITERELTEQALSALAGELAVLRGSACFEGSSRRLCSLLGLDYVFVGQLNTARDGVDLLAGWGAAQPWRPSSIPSQAPPAPTSTSTAVRSTARTSSACSPTTPCWPPWTQTPTSAAPCSTAAGDPWASWWASAADRSGTSA